MLRTECGNWKWLPPDPETLETLDQSVSEKGTYTSSRTHHDSVQWVVVDSLLKCGQGLRADISIDFRAGLFIPAAMDRTPRLCSEQLPGTLRAGEERVIVRPLAATDDRFDLGIEEALHREVF